MPPALMQSSRDLHSFFVLPPTTIWQQQSIAQAATGVARCCDVAAPLSADLSDHSHAYFEKVDALAGAAESLVACGDRRRRREGQPQ